MSNSLGPLAETVLIHTLTRAMKRAGGALAEMSGHAVSVTAPQVRRCSPAEVIEMAGGAEAVVVGIYVGITGALNGHALLILPPAGARRLARTLLDDLAPDLGDVGESSLDFDPLEISALQEVGNVTIGAFLNEVGMHLYEAVQPTVPQAIVEMAGAILQTVLADVLAETDDVLAAQTTFVEGTREVDGALLVLPRQGSLPALVDALGALG